MAHRCQAHGGGGGAGDRLNELAVVQGNRSLGIDLALRLCFSGGNAPAWMGGAERGDPHYYRIQGKTFLIELDNTQNGANHVHIVWRDFENDFGRDLLQEHYKSAPRNHGHDQ